MNRSNTRPGKGQGLKPRNTKARLASPCVHCGNPRATRPRKLCFTCYESRGIRDLYQPANSFVGKDGDFFGPAPLAEPSSAHPGTDDKIAVMAWRAAQGLAIFHPLDAVVDDDSERQMRLLGLFRAAETEDSYEDDE